MMRIRRLECRRIVNVSSRARERTDCAVHIDVLRSDRASLYITTYLR